MSQLKVLIIGASVAGPTTAYWFARAGADVTVIDRFPKLRPGGQNIDIRTAGVTVMRKMSGMEAAVRAKILPLEGLSFVDDEGRPYGIIKPSGNPDQQTIISEYEIFRGDLTQVLFDLTKNNKNIKYVFGEQVTSIQQNEQDDGPVTVEFANGLPTSSYDLVIACDGATSRTRAIGLGCGVRDHIHPVNCWAAYFSTKEDILEGTSIGLAHSSVGGRFMSVGPDPAGGNRAAMMSFYPRDGSDATLPFRTAQKQGDDALKHFVAQYYKNTGWKSDQILKEMMEAEDFYASEIVQVKVPSLQNGRFVLVGDAGYASASGGGTSLAIAGGYLLAGEVLKHGKNLAAGLKGYEEQMRPLITEFQKIPPLVPTIMAPQTVWGIWIRNKIFAFIAWTGILSFISKYFASAFANTKEYPLPEYDWVA